MTKVVKTTKKIDIADPSYRNQDANLKYLEFSNIRVSTSDDSESVRFIYTEKPYDIEIAQRQKIIDGIPQFDADGNAIMEDYEKMIFNPDYPMKERTRLLSYDEYFQMREQFAANLPADMPAKDKYKETNLFGLKYLIASMGFYKGQLTMDDFKDELR